MLTWLAVLVYLAPYAALFAARARRDRTLWEIALDIPTAAGADVVLVLLLSRLVPLETAALASRPAAVLAAALWIARRRRRGDRLGWPRALGVRALAAAGSSAVVAAGLSMLLSRKYHIWDRYWHINLVSCIRGQTVPFANVYDPSGPLSYHYSGDALAAMLQSFSLASLHASHTLSLAHDIMFALSGATLALFLVAWGARGVSMAVLSVVVWLLAGPPALLRDDGKQFAGYNFVNYLTLSFRPHVSLAGLLVLGFMGAVIARVREPEAGAAEPPAASTTAVALVVATAALSVTDEASCGVLGLALGAAWLVWPGVLGLDRKRGLALLAALLAAIVVTNLALAGLLSPGAARPPMKLVEWRSPGFANPTIPFSKAGGLKAFVGDVAALLLFGVAATLSFLRHRTRRSAAAAAIVLVLAGVGLFALGRFDIPPKPVEAHRFVTAAMIVAPLFALLWLASGSRSSQREGPLVRAVALVALALPAASTFAWLRSPGQTPLPTGKSFYTAEDFFETDCREELGARLGERPRPTYLATQVFFVYTGCRPVFTSGMQGGHRIKTSRPLFGWDALADLDKSVLRPGEPLDVICTARGVSDPICARALAVGGCTSVGTTRRKLELVRCTLDGAERADLLRTRPQPAPKPQQGARPPASAEPSAEPPVEDELAP
jgi:hypothetical protein